MTQKTIQQANLIQRLTPIQQLQADKQRIKTQCNNQEKILNQDFLYVQQNAGNLLLSGLSSIFFPTNKKSANTSKELTSGVSSDKIQETNVSFMDYFSLVPSLMPVVWDISKPIITAWGIKKMQHWVSNLLFKKKKEKINN